MLTTANKTVKIKVFLPFHTLLQTYRPTSCELNPYEGKFWDLNPLRFCLINNTFLHFGLYYLEDALHRRLGSFFERI